MTIGKYQEHAKEEYDRARAIRKKEMEISKANIKGTQLEIINPILNAFSVAPVKSSSLIGRDQEIDDSLVNL